jgi:hypothetical protein
MDFQAPTVQDKKNPKARISALGAILLVVAVFLAMMDGYEKYAVWAFGAAVLIFLLGVVLAKGDLTNVAVSNVIPLVVSSEGIRIGGEFYQMGQVKDIDFDIEGYAGMGITTLSLPAGGELDGMGNCLQFEYLNEQFECRFYLGGPQQAQQLGMLFRSFYEQRIPFVERRGLYQTFMFQPMSKKELEDTRRSYRYA